MNDMPLDIVADEEAAAPRPALDVVPLATSGENIAELMSEEELGRIGDDAVRLYRLDRKTMQDWLDRMKWAIDLAKLVKETKSYPWPNAANVRYPLITSAALQFNARAYPAIVPSDAPVKVKVFGADPGGVKAARGERIAAHMSWQLMSSMDEWEEETDKLLVQLPIVGTVVRKVWFDPVAGRPRCRVIAPGAFVVNDKIKALGDAPRMTEELALYPDEVESRIRAKTFRSAIYGDADGEDNQAPQDFIEQHCRLDLDEDGYAEPYVVTVHVGTSRVARIVGDFTETDVSWLTEMQRIEGPPQWVTAPDRMSISQVPTFQDIEVRVGIKAIRRGSYFVPYHFMPSMDGGFLGTGLGVLLGDTSETINSIINMMMDAGHMASLGGGFIGSEFRIKGGSQRFSPGEWKLATSKGQDIRSSIVPMTFPGPDSTLFSLLGMLIDAGKELASVKDVMTGETGGRQMTATTTLALIEQGMTVFTACYKRIYRSLKQEFKLLARINAETVSPEEYQAFHDEAGTQGEPGPDGQPVQPQPFDPAQDYALADMDILPVADPSSVTTMQQAAKAQVILQLADTGKVDPMEATKRVLEAASIKDVDALLPKPDEAAAQAAQQMQAMALKAAEIDLTLKAAEIDKVLAETERLRAQAMKDGADAASETFALAMQQMAMRLEAARDGLAAFVGGGLAGGGQATGGMAGLPGGGSGSLGDLPQPGYPSVGLPGGMVGGQPAL